MKDALKIHRNKGKINADIAEIEEQDGESDEDFDTYNQELIETSQKQALSE